jgi:hypothetical protein
MSAANERIEGLMLLRTLRKAAGSSIQLTPNWFPGSPLILFGSNLLVLSSFFRLKYALADFDLAILLGWN